MNLLPKWVLVNPFPAIHDYESLTAIEQTARIYGAMQSLINEYNAFAEETNKHLASFTEDEAEARKEFEIQITKVMKEFTCSMDQYLKLNLDDTATKVIMEGMNNGSIPVPTDSTLTRANYPADAAAVGVQKARIDAIASLPEGSTTGDAEVIDIRVDYKGVTHETAGEAVRSQAQTATDRINAIKENPIKKTIGITNGFSEVTLTFDDLSLLYDGVYIADDAGEVANEFWRIYQYVFPKNTLVKIKSITVNPDVSGVALGCYTVGIGNYRIMDYDIGKMFVAERLKFNYFKSSHNLSIKDITLQIFSAPQFDHTVLCRGKLSQCDRVIAFGDSIFYGHGIEGNKGVPYQLAELLGIPLENHAVNSATLTNVQPENNIVDQVTSATYEGKPLILIDGGTNDRYTSELTNLGEYGNMDPGNIYGAITYIINYLKAAGVEGWQIVITTPIPSNIRAEDRSPIDMQLSIIGYAMYQVGVVLGCNVINGYKTPFNYVDNVFAKQHLLPDDTHPSETGAKYYANMIYREIV